MLNTIITQLKRTCSCQLSAKYVTSTGLMCGDATTDRVILQGTLIGALESNSTDLHTQLQNWVDGSPTIEVIGIRLQVVPCSTYPGGEASCEFQEPGSATTAAPTTIPRVAKPEESSGLGGVTLYAAVGGGVAMLMIVAIVIILLALAIKKRRNKTYTTNR